jgi:hypothetical protein
MKLNTGFSRITPVKFAAQVDLIITSLTGNTNFPEPWPASVPTLAQLQTDLNSFQSAVNAIATKDRSQMVNRDATRQKLSDELTSIAYYLQSVAKGDATMLATTGFPARKEPQRTLTPAEMTPPAQLTVERGALSGQLIIRASRVDKAASYDVQIATADPTLEASWSDAGSYATCRRIELNGLTPGKVYSVRVRALGAAGPGSWTPASSLMVV